MPKVNTQDAKKTAMQVESWPIARVRPYAKNARQIPPDAVAKVARSIAEYSFRQPIVVDEHGVILAGHTRLMAAEKLGLTEVPVHVAAGLTATQARAYRLMDNRSHQESRWDFDLLAVELGELRELDFDLTLTGFDPSELERHLGHGDGLTDEDAAPGLPKHPITRPGDLWACGAHRLLCGDATVATDVERLLGGVKPHLMVTDPPYGVEYDPGWRVRAERASGKAPTAHAVGQVQNDDRADWREAWALFPGDVAYVWHAGSHASTVQESLEAVDLEIRSQIVWAKPRAPISRGHYHWQHEPCWYAVRKGATGHWSGDRTQTTLWTIEHRKSDTGHGTQKPVECMRRPIVNNSREGDAVYDPFLGSGTTMIAAETTGRACYGIEIDPAYVDVAILRWMDFTGKVATLDGDGRTFADDRRTTTEKPIAEPVG
jgi:DNA modification methylase